MSSHLKLYHPKENAEVMKKKAEKESKYGEKRKQSEEENEMEGGTVPLFNLRTSRQRQEFLVQSKVSSWVTGGGATKADLTYDIHDARAKEKHKGILMMVIMDLQPWSMVNDPGFLYFSSQMDPHYKVASDKFYRGLLDKAFKKGVTRGWTENVSKNVGLQNALVISEVKCQTGSLRIRNIHSEI